MNDTAGNCIPKLGCILILLTCLYDVQAVLKTTFVEDICRGRNWAGVDLRFQKSGILMASPFYAPIDCMITLLPRTGYSVVLSIYSYELEPTDKLTIEDSDRYKFALIGSGNFANEKKSIVSEGKIVIHYFRNETTYSRKQGFQFTYTQVRSSPCSSVEFRCKNQKCIPKELACDGHNHCGDNSDQKECVPREGVQPTQFAVQEKRYSVSITVGVVCGIAVLLVIIITLIVLIVRQEAAKKAKKAASSSPENQQVSSPAATSSVSPNVQPRPTVFQQIRRSLRLQRAPQTEELPRQQTSPEAYEVPSLYPNLNQLPCAPGYEGVDNPSFTRQ